MDGICRTADLYTVFRVALMHVLSLSVSRLLKEYLIKMLSDDKETANSMDKLNTDHEPFHQIKRIVFSKLNKFSSSWLNGLQGLVFKCILHI